MITSKFPRGQLLTPGRNQHFQNETEKQNLKTISCSRTNDFWFPPALHIMDNCKVYRHFPPSDCLSHTPKRILTNPPVLPVCPKIFPSQHLLFISVTSPFCQFNWNWEGLRRCWPRWMERKWSADCSLTAQNMLWRYLHHLCLCSTFSG